MLAASAKDTGRGLNATKEGLIAEISNGGTSTISSAYKCLLKLKICPLRHRKRKRETYGWFSDLWLFLARNEEGGVVAEISFPEKIGTLFTVLARGHCIMKAAE